MENAQLSDEREQLARQLVQSQKLETAGQLAAGVAHDFNNLLTVIMGYAYSGLAHLPPQSPAEPDLEEIEKAAGRAETQGNVAAQIDSASAIQYSSTNRYHEARVLLAHGEWPIHR